MASASFRDQMNALGWSRRGQDEPVNTSQQSGLLTSIKSLNPFGDRGYVRLPTTEGAGAPLPAASRREEEEAWFAFLSLRPSKFVILWTLGSALFLASFAAVMGPWAYVQHLLSGPRLPFTGAYFGSIFLTFYFSLGLHSTILTLFSAIIQLVCLVWYLVSYFPMGSSGLRVASSFGARRAAAWVTG
ncbi:hypothetical protein J7T55_008656 [Diaporthe amygdali]|uniref:uncharacterized protein n=1 Tax=Phomopsis amygdali TaxID=1214568 RepID=UPI0022FEA310|nr:uncharacterized protein J7T55_008656 [Diaporthe amygdali]KAJ0121492.1 hypothetical protein J7T55_008656 [Diaporthe amygdali]